ncbi:MAG: TIGR03118 family protein [Pseudomonadota bacterium]
MSKQWNAGVTALALTLTTLAGCNGGSGGGSPASVAAPTNYTAIPLVTNRDDLAAPRHDTNLVSPWALIFANGFAWTANSGSNSATVYDAGGIAQPTIVRIPGSAGEGPTGIVYNPNPTDFRVTSPGATGSAQVIFATRGGTIAAWSGNSTFGSTALTVYDDGTGNASYSGLALVDVNGSRFLYAADFRNGKIDTWDANFNRVTTIGGFLDTTLPAGYSPYGIHTVGSHLLVTYARQAGTNSEDEQAGEGLGYVNEFDGSGRLVRRVASAGELNAPWGVAVAPNGFGKYSKSLLIANAGDGHINAYDPESGAHLGTLESAEGVDLAIPGLRAIAFPYIPGTTGGTGTDGSGTGGTGTGGTGTGGTGTGTGTGGTGTGGTGTGTGGTGTGGTGTGGTGGTGTGGTGTGGTGTGNMNGFQPTTLYYTSGGTDERSGTFGRIAVSARVDTGTGTGGNTGGDGTGTDGTGTGGTGTGGTGTGGTGTGGTGTGGTGTGGTGTGGTGTGGTGGTGTGGTGTGGTGTGGTNNVQNGGGTSGAGGINGGAGRRTSGANTGTGGTAGGTPGTMNGGSGAMIPASTL